MGVYRLKEGNSRTHRLKDEGNGCKQIREGRQKDVERTEEEDKISTNKSCGQIATGRQ